MVIGIPLLMQTKKQMMLLANNIFPKNRITKSCNNTYKEAT